MHDIWHKAVFIETFRIKNGEEAVLGPFRDQYGNEIQSIQVAQYFGRCVRKLARTCGYSSVARRRVKNELPLLVRENFDGSIVIARNNPK